MGMFAFRRLREREATSKEVASFSMQEPAAKLDVKPAAKKRRAAKQEPVDGDHT